MQSESGRDDDQPEMQKPGGFSLRVIREKCNIVQVFENVDERKKKLFWQFNLDKNKNPIILQSFIDDSRFVILDWQGYLWCYDIIQKKCVYHRDFQASLASYAFLSDDRKRLYLSLQLNRLRNLLVMALDSFEVIEQIQLKNRVYCYALWQNRDGRLMHYFHDQDFTTDESSHGFVTLDMKSKEEEKFTLSHPRQRHGGKLPWLDTKNGIGVRAYYDIDVKKAGNEERFLSKVAVFDLQTFTDTAIIVAREYKADQLGYTMESGTEDPSAEELRIAAEAKKPSDAVETFVDDINSVFFTGDGHFWICYRGGILRKIALDGSRLSTYVIGNPRMAFPPEGGVVPFMSKYFHSHIERIDEPEIILTDHDRHYRLVLPDTDLFATREVVTVDLEEYDPNAELILSKKETREQDEIGLNILHVESITDKTALIGALKKIAKMMEDIAAIRTGDTLSFLIKDGKKSLAEKKFFKKVAEYQEARPILKKILGHFVSFPDAGALYMDEETTALACAAEALATSGPEYIDSYMDYLCVIDMEHDVINRERIIPGLLKHWKKTEAEYRLRTSFVLTDDAELCDSGFFEELEKKKEFFKWFSEKKNQKATAKWMADCSRKGIGNPIAEVKEQLRDHGLTDFLSNLEAEL